MNAQKRPKRKPSTKLTLPPFGDVVWCGNGHVTRTRSFGKGGGKRNHRRNKKLINLKSPNYTGGKQDDSAKAWMDKFEAVEKIS